MLPVAGRAQNAPVEPVPEESALTVAEIQRRLDDTDRIASLEENVKAQIVELYRQAIEALKRAESARAKKAEFDAARESAPAKLAETRAQLASFSDAFELDLDRTAPLSELEARLAQAESELRDARAAALAIEEEQSRRSERRTELPGLIAGVRARLDAVTTELAQPIPTDQPKELTFARRSELRARRAALRADAESYESELSSYDARTELLQARRELALKKVARVANVAKAWQELVAEARRRDAQIATREAARARREAARAHPALRPLAEENAAWADRLSRDDIVSRIERTKQEETRSAELLEQISTEFSAVTARVKAAGVNPTMAIALRRLHDVLPSLSDRIAASKRRESAAASARLEWLDLQDAQRKLVEEGEAIVRGVVNSLDAGTSEEQRRDIAAAATELLEARQGYIAALIKNYDTYARALVDLDGQEQQLISLLAEIHNYVDERILWIQSATFPRRADADELAEAFGELVSPRNWLGVGTAIRGTFSQALLPGILLVLMLAALFAAGRPAVGRIGDLGQAAVQPFSHSVGPTMNAALLTAVLIARWPAALWVIGWTVGSHAEQHDFAAAIAHGVYAAAAWVLLLEFVRHVCRPDGLGEAHFAWSTSAVNKVRRHLLWFTLPSTVAVLLFAYSEATGREAWINTLGRIAFIVAQILIVVFNHVVLHPKRGVLASMSHAAQMSTFVRFRTWWYGLAVVLPALLAGLSLYGYHYTASRLADGLLSSLWLILLIVLANDLALRRILVYRRKRSIRDFHERRRAAGDAEVQPDPPIDLNVVTAQAGNLLRAVGVFAFLLGLWAIWQDTLPALRVLDEVELWTTVERVTTEGADTKTGWIDKPVPVTLRDLGASIIIFVVTFIAVRNLPGLVELAILERLQLGAAQRFAITTVSRYVLILVGLILGFGAIGVGWAKVQWLAAAATVGLGFGLQEIFANFVSGLIILFERPIRLGDVVTVEGIEGRVTRIQMRATTITDWDMRELIVPNKDFITNRLINWTLSDPTTRVVVPVGIAYGSDTRRATDLLLKVARENPHVVDNPPPHVVFVKFGENSLDFQLRVYIATRNVWVELTHTLHMAIDQEFRKAGIEIAFPQRDLHLRSVKAPIRVDLSRPSDAPDAPGDTE